MDAFPAERHVDLAAFSHHRTRAGIDLPRRKARPEVKAEDMGNAAALQNAALAQGASPAGVFLCRLKNQQHIPPQTAPPRLHPPGKAQQQGSVAVVAAGVHPPRVPRGEGQARFLCHWQGVHIRPEGGGLRLSFVKIRAHGPLGGLQHGAGKGGKLRLHIGAGLRQMLFQLRDAVQVPAALCHILQHGLGSFVGIGSIVPYIRRNV